MRGPGRNKCLHGSCLWKHSPLDALIRAFLQERRSSSNIAGSDDCISSYIPCHCAPHSLFKWEHGNSISLHTEVDYLWNVGIFLLTLERHV